jgi:hypothetical protein
MMSGTDVTATAVAATAPTTTNPRTMTPRVRMMFLSSTLRGVGTQTAVVGHGDVLLSSSS